MVNKILLGIVTVFFLFGIATASNIPGVTFPIKSATSVINTTINNYYNVTNNTINNQTYYVNLTTTCASGYVLQNISNNIGQCVASGGGSGTPAGNNQSIQFNDNGAFGGSDSFTFDKNTNLLHLTSPNVDSIMFSYFSNGNYRSIIHNDFGSFGALDNKMIFKIGDSSTTGTVNTLTLDGGGNATVLTNLNVKNVKATGVLDGQLKSPIMLDGLSEAIRFEYIPTQSYYNKIISNLNSFDYADNWLSINISDTSNYGSHEVIRFMGNNRTGINTQSPKSTLDVNGLTTTINLNATGNITGNSLYGELWFDNDSVGGVPLTIGATNTWYNISFNGSADNGTFLNGFTTTSQSLICQDNGLYSVTYSVSAEIATGGTKEFNFAVSNGTDYYHQTETHTQFATQSNPITIADGGFVRCSPNLNLYLITRQITSSAVNLGISQANLKAERIGN